MLSSAKGLQQRTLIVNRDGARVSASHCPLPEWSLLPQAPRVPSAALVDLFTDCGDLVFLAEVRRSRCPVCSHTDLHPWHRITACAVPELRTVSAASLQRQYRSLQHMTVQIAVLPLYIAQHLPIVPGAAASHCVQRSKPWS